jgi:hypothetical protein
MEIADLKDVCIQVRGWKVRGERVHALFFHGKLGMFEMEMGAK